jgi:translocation protein SEC63
MSFKENFERDDSKNDVQYDDSAFYTFGGTMLLCIILPIAYAITKRLFTKNDFEDSNTKNCNCSLCKEKIKNLFSKKKRNARNYTFYFYIVSLLLLCYVSYNCYFEIKENSGNFKTFNPFEILEIEADATEQQIKKAYKRLALKYHPDRNPNNSQAKAKFMMISKAYEALTNETARKNWELYGNPDGPGSMRLAVGLPSFVLNKKNHMPILILFLIFIVIILPAFVLYWFSSTNNYDDAGVQVINHRIYYELLNENILMRQMPFVLGCSIEFAAFTVRGPEVDELKKLYRKYAELMPKHKEEVIPMGNKKAICLLYSHLDDTSNLSIDSLNKDLADILELSPNFVFTMFQVARQYTFMKEMQELQIKQMGIQMDHKMIIKNFGLGCIKVILEFSQILVQKQGFKASPYMQLPNFSENLFKQNKSLNKIRNDFAAFLLMSEENMRNILAENETFAAEQIQDIIEACKSIPKYKVSVEIAVDGFEDIVKDDLVTFKFKVVKENLEDKMVISNNSFFL